MRRITVLFLVSVLSFAGSSPSGAIAQATSIAPVTIRIPGILVNTTIETAISDPDPRGAWSVLWYEGYGNFGSEGNTVLYGYRDFGGIGPGVFYFFDQLEEGDPIEIAGSDGTLNTYELTTLKTLDAATASIEEIFGASAEEKLTLFSYGGEFDEATQTYRTIFLAEAVPIGSTPHPADKPAGVSPGCPVAPRNISFPDGSRIDRRITSGSGMTAELDLSHVAPADPGDIASIDALLAESSGCDMAVREAVALPDGRVLALVGPDGHLPIEMITAPGGDTTLRTDPAGTVCDFALFTRAGDSWSVEAVPWL